MGLCFVFCTRPVHSDALCAGLPDGDAVRRADAVVCRAGAAWRPAYAGIPDGCGWSGCADFRAVAGDTQVGTGTAEDASDRRCLIWCRPRPVWTVASLLAFTAVDGRCGIRDDAG